MLQCGRCGTEVEGGEEMKTCPKCGCCYSKNEHGKWVSSGKDLHECVWKG